jgi:hypothetical protein
MNPASTRSIADLLNDRADATDRPQWRRLARQGVVTLALTAAAVAFWAAAAPIAGAVVAPARIKVELNR